MTCDHLIREGLLARELGRPDDHVSTCADCQAELPRYRFVADISRLVALSPSPPGWERRVWAQIDRLERPRWRRGLARAFGSGRWILAPALVVVAVLAIVLSRAPSQSIRLALDLERRPSATGTLARSVTATVGDQITAHARGAAALWVYRATDNLLARCQGDPECRTTRGGLELTFVVAVAGRYRVLGLAGPGAAEVTPTGDFDRDVLSARGRGARLELRAVDVAAAP